MTRACANCEFWHATDSVLQGECRRHAPRMTSDTGGWFHTQSTDWCGEHSPRGGKVRPLSYRELGADC